jgi:adenosylcobinamide-GDP ribazoletransferase
MSDVRAGGRLAALRLALSTLTVLPVRRETRLDRRTAGRAMELAPLVGLGLALVTAAAVHLLRVLGAPQLLAAVAMVALLALLTRGLHLDGLADTADGLASYRDPEGTRAVMKAPNTGPLGMSALLLVLLCQVAALASAIGQHRGTISLCVAVVAGRLAVTWACSGPPAATAEGLGALVARTVRPPVVAAWAAFLLVAAAVGPAVDPDATGTRGGRAALGVVAVVVALAATRALRGHVVRRVGGVTGDVLGALSEVTTTLALVVLALSPP